MRSCEELQQHCEKKQGFPSCNLLQKFLSKQLFILFPAISPVKRLMANTCPLFDLSEVCWKPQGDG